MANIVLSDLVNDNRFPNENFLNILLYFPVGIILAIVRSIIGILVWLASAILPEVSFLRLFITNFTCFTLGVYVKNKGQRDEKTRLIVTNCVSIMDPLALHVSTSSISPSKWDLPPPLAWALGIRHLGNASSNEQLRDAVKKKFADIPNVPIAIQPEGCPTSGKAVMKFSEWPFMLYDKVQPAAIEVNRWFGNVTNVTGNHWVHNSIAWNDLFWFLWSPYTIITVDMLPTMERIEKETNEEFAARVQKSIADYLKIEATQHTSNQLKELVLSRKAAAARAAAAASSSGGHRHHQSMPTTPSGAGGTGLRPEMQRMAAQVKEVLPAVPWNVILNDLAKTRSIDITLSNILEGVVPYTPEEIVQPLPPKEKDTSPGPSKPSAPLNTAASTFPRTAHDRQLSYQERKAQLIQAARQRFIEKHNLTHLL